jgi:capsular polysaccharide biosynthesis protein
VTSRIANPDNIYHGTLHSVIPFWYLRECAAISPDLPLLLLHEPTPFELGILELLELPFVKSSNSAFVEDLCRFRPTDRLMTLALRLFRSRYAEIRKPPQNEWPEKVYFSRPPGRRSANTNVEKLLVSQGYTPVRMDLLTFSDQLEVAQAARHWVADHGAALTHLLFGDPISIVELSPTINDGTVFGKFAFRDLLLMANLDTHHSRLTAGPLNAKTGTFDVPLKMLEEHLALVRANTD